MSISNEARARTHTQSNKRAGPVSRNEPQCVEAVRGYFGRFFVLYFDARARVPCDGSWCTWLLSSARCSEAWHTVDTTTNNPVSSVTLTHVKGNWVPRAP